MMRGMRMSGVRGRARLGGALAVACLLLAASGGAARAQEAGGPGGVDWPEFDTTTPIKKEFRAVKHYNFSIRHFSPSVVVTPMAAPAAFHDAPEEAVRAHISAMRAGDYEWWLSTMDQATQALSQGADKQRGVTVDDRLAAWRARFDGVASITMEDWIETGRYIIITLRMHSVQGESGGGENDAAAADLDDAASQKFALPLSIRDGQWLVTGFLGANDPVLTDYDHPDFANGNTVVFERIVRSARE